MDKLIFFLFVEKNSQLHREKNYGIKGVVDFENLIFGNRNFLTSKYVPLSVDINYSNFNSFHEGSVSKYLKIINFSLETYLKSDDNYPQIFFSAFNSIVQIIDLNVNALNSKDRDIIFSSAYKRIQECSTGIILLISFIKIKADNFPLDILSNIPSDYCFYKNDITLYGAIATGIYEVIKSLSNSKFEQEGIRLILISIYEIGTNTPPIISLQRRLDFLLSKKIRQNITNNLGPIITADLIYSFGLCEPSETEITIHKYLLNQLKNDFLAAYQSNSEVALKLLPEDTEFDVKNKKLVRKEKWIESREIEELILDDGDKGAATTSIFSWFR